MERGKQFLFILFLAVLLAGCGWKNLDSKKEETLEFTVVEEEDLPEEAAKILEERKMEPFQISCESGGYLYLLRGYGRQSSGGYSVQVRKLAATEDAVYFSTELLGPADGGGAKRRRFLSVSGREDSQPRSAGSL